MHNISIDIVSITVIYNHNNNIINYMIFIAVKADHNSTEPNSITCNTVTMSYDIVHLYKFQKNDKNKRTNGGYNHHHYYQIQSVLLL